MDDRTGSRVCNYSPSIWCSASPSSSCRWRSGAERRSTRGLGEERVVELAVAAIDIRAEFDRAGIAAESGAIHQMHRNFLRKHGARGLGRGKNFINTLLRPARNARGDVIGEVDRLREPNTAVTEGARRLLELVLGRR